MADITYTPEFEHDDWVDNVSRVQAAGPDGFNIRFNTIQQDLANLSTVVGQIDAALDAIVVAPAPQQQRLTISPAVHPTEVNTTTPSWYQDQSGMAQAAHINGVANSKGVVNLVLPDRARLISMRVLGRKVGPGTNVTADLLRTALAGNVNQSLNLCSLSGTTDPFDLSKAVTATNDANLVDTSLFRYTVGLTANGIEDTSIMTVGAIEIIYQA